MPDPIEIDPLLCPFARVLGKAVLLRSLPECSG
jgi:hypothetical protein